MKLPLAEDKSEAANLMEKLLSYESPFSWDMPKLIIPIEQYIRNQKEKCEVIEEEHQFQWTRFIPHLVLSYELCENMMDYAGALEHINWCADHWGNLQHKCNEPLFQSLREVLSHVISVTQAHIFLAAGEVKAARERAFLSSAYRLLSIKDRAGLLGLKAAAYLQYQSGMGRALETARKARDLDPDQAEWWFIIGVALTRIGKHDKEEVIFTEAMKAIEKAFALQKDASYTVYLASLYSDYSKELFFKQDYEKARTYALKAASRFREALEMRPNCTNMKARVAHGLLRTHKEVMDASFAKNLLDEVIKCSPNKALAYGDLAFYYENIERDTEKALFNLQKACEVGSIKCVKFLMKFKWRHGLEDQIIADVKKNLRRFKNEDDQAMLYTYLGACYALINDDWKSAISCFQISFDLDPTAKHLENFQGFNWKVVNMLELVVNHLHFRAADENQNMVKSFLDMVTQKKPQKVVFGGRNKFTNWKTGLENQKLYKRSNSIEEIVDNEKEIALSTGKDDYIHKEKEHLAMISSQMEELLHGFKTLATKEEVKSIGTGIESMREELTSIVKKVEVLEPRVTGTETRLGAVELKLENIEKQVTELLSLGDVVGEVNDRARRATNIIFHNLPETDAEPLKMKVTYDRNLFLKVCQAMNYNLDMAEIKLKRIGAPMRGKCRPLLVIFKTAEESKRFMKHLSVDCVKSSDPALVNFGVSRDKTDKERRHLKFLREELDNRTRKGESNLTIKYINRLPIIVPKPSENQ